MHKLALLLATLVCASCASANKSTQNGSWYNPNKTPEQTKEDWLNCDMMRQVAYHRPEVSGGLLTQMAAQSQEQERVDNIFVECMLSKGYVFTPSTNMVERAK